MSAISAATSSGPSSESFRNPSISGTVSISKTSTGIMLIQPGQDSGLCPLRTYNLRGTWLSRSGRENTGGKIAVAAIADDRNNYRVVYFGRNLERSSQRTP